MTPQTKNLVIAEIELKMATGQSFTAFDITQALRSAGEQVLHYEVREEVHNHMTTTPWVKQIDTNIPGQPWRYSNHNPQPTLQGQPVFIAKGPASNLTKDIINNSTDVDVNGKPVVRRNFADQLSGMVKDVGKKAVDVMWGPVQQLAKPSNLNTQASALTQLHHSTKGLGPKIVKRSNRGRLWVSIDRVKVLAASLNSIQVKDIKEIAVMEGKNQIELIYPPFQAASKTYAFDQQRKGIKISKELLDRVFGSSATRFKIEEKSDGLVLTRA